jgi:thiamine biosynthesis lipoprotein ApbE
MAELLEEWEIRSVLIHGGFSSVLARDAPPGRDGWPLTLTAPGPGDDRPRTRVSARQMALSASGTQKGAHVRDPRTGRGVQGRAAWAVVSGPAGSEAEAGGEWRDAVRSPAAVAEGLSTAFMILPVPEIADLCRRGPGLEAWLVREPPAAGDPRGGLVHVAPARAGGGRGEEVRLPRSDDSLVGWMD